MGPFRMEIPVAEEGCALETDLSIAWSSDFDILAAETVMLIDKSATDEQIWLEQMGGVGEWWQ